MSRWSTSSVLQLKKSKFKAFCTPIKSNLEIPDLLMELYNLDKNLNKATHPCMYAWKTASSRKSEMNTQRNSKKRSTIEKEQQIYIEKLENMNQGFHDNNEGGSGSRILGLIDRIHLVNVLIVVSRWYGGTPLGPSRFKCISDVGFESVKNAGFYVNNRPEKSWIDCTKVMGTFK